MRFEFTLFGRHHVFHWDVSREKAVIMSGVTNRCKDGQFVLFLDYDDVPLGWVVDELRFLIMKYSLGDVHIFQTGGGYHAVCTQKFHIREIVEIMRYTMIDPQYLNVPLSRAIKMWTLRTSKKGARHIKFLKTLPGERIREESRVHNDLLRKLYNLRLPRELEDKETRFFCGYYAIHE